MKEDDVFIIEIFDSTDKCYVRDDVEVYDYARNEHVSAADLHHVFVKSLLKTIDENFETLIFFRRYLECIEVKNYHLDMRSLVSNDIVEFYESLIDVSDSYVAQFEHVSMILELKIANYADAIF